ncbi:hypothetical protein [Methylobacterium radiotolerans]|uniref:hypothetical protein n=1 Tax=Methylobacterium radiotolerans TaxID=31998 RepID=UPI000975A9B9|nr:hypothetical protein [Methylobacterium radiotolerans]ONF49431.1 hypothetical protein RSM1_09150 [Methylobacterium radiotolerans]
MIRRAALLLIPLAVSACSGDRPSLAEASGPYRPLNEGRWSPTDDDLRGPRAPIAPKDSPSLHPAPAVPVEPASTGAPIAQPDTRKEGL